VKGASEARVREALTRLAGDMQLTWWKPPDDARNWKPADYLLWYTLDDDLRSFACGKSAMLEVKDNPALKGYSVADLRPIQRAWMHHAERVRVPYWLVIWWRRRQVWTVTAAAKVLAKIDEGETNLPFTWLASVGGVDSANENLAGTLGAALRGEID
jgi:hypothetical protein